MRWLKAFIIIGVIPIIATVITGNIFDFTLAYKHISSELEKQYGNDLRIVGYNYNKETKSQGFTVCDNSGIEAEYVYLPKTNEFIDSYGDASLRVSMYTLRGSIINVLRANKCYPDEVDVDVQATRCIIGQDNKSTVAKLILVITENDKTAFITEVKKAVNAIKDYNIKRVEVYSDLFSITVTFGILSDNNKDIEAKIKTVG